MKIKIVSMSFIEKAFYILWTIFSVTYFFLHESEMYYMFDVTKHITIITYLTIIGLVVLLVMQNKYSLKTLIAYSLFLGLVMCIEMSIKNQIFLVYILFIMVAQFIDFKRFVRYDLILKTVIFLTVISLCMVGFLDNYTAISESQIKQSLGFTHPNKFSCIAFTILVEWIYVRFEKIKIYEWVLIAIGCYYIKSIGASRTTLYVFMLIYVLFILAKIKPELFYSRIVKLLFVLITPFMAFLSFFTTYLYSKGNIYMYVLDNLLTHRIQFQAQFLEKYAIKLFGQNIVLTATRTSTYYGTERAILDNAYIRCVLMYGMIFFVMLCALYSILMYQFLNRRRVELAIFSLFFVLYAFGESYMLSTLYNVTLLCFLGINQMGIVQKEENHKKKFRIRIKI